MCERSDYFKALLENHFGESSEEHHLPVITLNDISINVFVQVLYYIYQDSCEEVGVLNSHINIPTTHSFCLYIVL